MSWDSQLPVGELMAGETPRFHRGVCEVLAVKDGKMVSGNLREIPDHIVVRGESGHHIERITLDGLEPQDVDRRLATVIEKEMKAL